MKLDVIFQKINFDELPDAQRNIFIIRYWLDENNKVHLCASIGEVGRHPWHVDSECIQRIKKAQYEESYWFMYIDDRWDAE